MNQRNKIEIPFALVVAKSSNPFPSLQTEKLVGVSADQHQNSNLKGAES